MSAFDDAVQLLAHSQSKLGEVEQLYMRCLDDQIIAVGLLVEVKTFMGNLQSILDYCARGLHRKYGSTARKHQNVYFPVARPPDKKPQADTDEKIRFRKVIVPRAIPGLLDNRPDVVDVLEGYQYFGNTGNWLPLFMDLANEQKHERLVPQIEKQYLVVKMRGMIPDGGRMTIDLTNISLGGGPGAPYYAFAGTWSGLIFEGTNVQVLPHLKHVLQNVARIVDELKSV